ncbi:MAG: AAA family ATPase, partial [Planctomycetaceae bacterium]|nr:AAA family ATPase [Planctomycetaceae bacterium]
MSALEKEVPPELLRWKCNLDVLPFETTTEIDPVQGVVGQPTAFEALKFGIQCLAHGQNVYVRGARGTGRITMVRQMLEGFAPVTPAKRDFCYVHNFRKLERPRLITLPPGQAGAFRKSMEKLAEFVEDGLPKAIESEPHASRRQVVQDEVQASIKLVTEPLEKEIESNGMALVSVQQGPATQTMIMPVVDGEPVSPEALRAKVAKKEASEEQLKQFEDAFPGYQKKLVETSREVNSIIRLASQKVISLTEKYAAELLGNYTVPIQEKYQDAAVKAFLEDVVGDVIENHLHASDEDGPNLKELYGVNVVLSHDPDESRPVIEENTPSLINLLGTVESDLGPGGMAISDYRGVRAGALLQADQGYLILDVNDVVSEPGAWRALMRTLRTGRLEIVPPEAGWMRQTVIT